MLYYTAQREICTASVGMYIYASGIYSTPAQLLRYVSFIITSWPIKLKLLFVVFRIFRNRKSPSISSSTLFIMNQTVHGNIKISKVHIYGQLYQPGIMVPEDDVENHHHNHHNSLHTTQ